jgi:hypothetical protein
MEGIPSSNLLVQHFNQGAEPAIAYSLLRLDTVAQVISSLGSLA